MEASELIAVLRRSRFRFGTELSLQNDLESLLQELEVPHVRERRLGSGAIDFLAGEIGLECKVDGSAGVVLRQLLRYAGFDEVKVIVLVTSRSTHRWEVSELNGKPFYVVHVARFI